MSDVATNAPQGQKPVRKRSKLERAFVWGGISLLLVAVAVEFQSSRGCESTLAELKQNLKGGNELPIKDLKKHISGFAIQGEEGEGLRRCVTLHWPSLFRSHKLRLGVRGTDQISFAEAYDLDGGLSKSSTPIIPTAKLKGLPAGYENVVALTTNDLSSAPNTTGILLRELIRQGLLIAAQDELRLATLDASLGEPVPMKDVPTSFPFSVKISVQDNPSRVDGKFVLEDQGIVIEVFRPTPDGKTFVSEGLTLTLLGENRIESLAATMAEMSRGPFVDVLTKAGYQKSNETNDVIPASKLDDRMDFVSQFATLREVHSQIRAKGESPELVGRLVRASANLGSLTDYQWNATGKVFKARALIYAERLIAKAGETPFTLAHRAYAQALAGRHGSALQAAFAAAKAKGQAAPDWLPIIVAYCEFKSEQLEKVDSQQELAKFLQLRQFDVNADSEQQSGLQRLEQMLEKNGACSCAAEIMGSIRALGPQRGLVQSVYPFLWPEVYARLRSVVQLPSAVAKLADTGSKVEPEKMDLEFAVRGKLLSELKKNGADGKTPGIPSWSILEDMLRELSFLQAFHTLDVQGNMLGIPAEHTLVELRPLYEDHRYAPFLTSSFGRDRKSMDDLTTFFNDLDLTNVDLTFIRIASIVQHRSHPKFSDLFNAMHAHTDMTYEDVMRNLGSGEDPNELIEISPNCPKFIASTIRREEFEERRLEWEEKYAAYPVVLNTLAQHYEGTDRPADAIRCLEKSIAITPSLSAYKSLAEIYKDQEDFEKWQSTLERALKLPSFGLEGGMIRAEIAYALMRKGEWDKAEVFADEAAETGSAWGMKASSRCAEGLGNWEKAEAMIRAVSERYESSREEWYFWCARTGRGNLEEAKEEALPYWLELESPLSYETTRQLACHQLLQGESKEARDTLADFLKQGDLRAGLFAAILADDQGENDLRDSLLAKIEKEIKVDECQIEFLNLINGVLSGEERGRWNTKDFDRAMIVADKKSVPTFYFFAAMFLRKHGEQELADQYLQNAATSFDVNSMGCILANHFLRQANKTVGPTRLNILADDLAVIDVALNKADQADGPKDTGGAERVFDQAVQLREDFVPSLLQRAAYLQKRHNYKAAIADYEKAITLDPRCFPAHANLAWILATSEQDEIRDGKKAMEHAKLAAAQRFYKSRRSMEVLAAAHAEIGEFKEAEALQKVAETMHDHGMQSGGQRRQYAAGKPYRMRPLKPADTQ